MSEEKMREEFEAWAIREYWLPECALARKKSGVYRDSRAVLAWQAWQASRAALVVELPERPEKMLFGGDFLCGWMAMEEDIREAIESAGVRVKP